MPPFRDIHTKIEESHSLLHGTQSCFVEWNETFGQKFIPFGFKSKEQECVQDVLGASVLRS